MVEAHRGIIDHQVETIRPLVGFLTSGGFSYHHGRGVGVGAVLADVLAKMAEEQGRAVLGWFKGLISGENLRKPWVFPLSIGVSRKKSVKPRYPMLFPSFSRIGFPEILAQHAGETV